MPANDLLLNETYDSLRPGPITEVVTGAFREMHAQPAHPDDNLGGWERRFGWWTLPKDPWTVVESEGGRRIESSATATVYDNVWLAKGDRDWHDITIETTMRLLPLGEGWGGPAGVLFRFMDSRRHYAACVDADGQAKLLKRRGNNWELLAAKSGDFRIGQDIGLRVEASGSTLKARVGDVELGAVDGEIPAGCIGFVGAMPASFGPLTVRALPGEAERLDKVSKAAASLLASKRAKYGKPVLWKKIETPGFGSGRRVRVGDLTGDGRLDFLFLQIEPDNAPAIACMTAVSADGEVLWQRGSPVPVPTTERSTDGPAQIHDIDGDGRREVVCAWGGEMLVLDGASGAVKSSAPIPPMSPLPDIFKENMLSWGSGYGDDGPLVKAASIAFADLAGRGRPADVILCDNYHTIVAMDSDMKVLWRSVLSHGHYPMPYDFDGDGRDDVLGGYKRFGPDGRILGRVCLQDHQDAIFAGSLRADGKHVRVLMAGGEDGLLNLTPGYDISQRVMGHVQRLSVGRFREETPDMCVSTCLFHGNHGIVSLFDPTLKRIWKKDFPVVGSTLQPVNWDGSGVELMFYSGIRPSQGQAGGLIDGDGELVVPMPDDGGPGFCAFAYDFDGDGLDELMVWDYDRVCIYHTDREPAGGPDGRNYRPIRPPLWNTSNFQSYWSRPNWA